MPSHGSAGLQSVRENSCRPYGTHSGFRSTRHLRAGLSHAAAAGQYLADPVLSLSPGIEFLPSPWEQRLIFGGLPGIWLAPCAAFLRLNSLLRRSLCRASITSAT